MNLLDVIEICLVAFEIIQIINFLGPDYYIDMEKFAAGKVRARRYRNPKIGESFKEIDLSEKKSTGISKILREVITQKDYNKVSTIASFMEENGKITPKEAETITGKSAETV